MSKEALQLQPFIDQGYSKERVLEVLDSIGFAENKEKLRMKEMIEEAFND